jgi:NAD(P)-dependent dehydrogenase (short-subunit alcohol dehydrogenase family)
MDMRFDGRVAIVTGAGRGLGRAYAQLLAARGASVVVNDLGAAVDGGGEDLSPAAEVVLEIEAAGGVAVANGDSVATAEGAAAIAQTALDRFGRIDIIIHNAGILTEHIVPETTQDDVANHMDVNLFGGFNLARAAWPHMVEQSYGRIVFTTSTSIYGQETKLSYAAAKSALVGMARTLAIVGAKHGINVNLVAPGAKTRMAVEARRHSDGVPNRDATDQAAAATSGPDMVAPAVAYLVHESTTATAETLIAGRGRVARMFLAETVGYIDLDLTIESIRDHWDTICDPEGFITPTTAADQVAREAQLFATAKTAAT